MRREKSRTHNKLSDGFVVVLHFVSLLHYLWWIFSQVDPHTGNRPTRAHCAIDFEQSKWIGCGPNVSLYASNATGVCTEDASSHKKRQRYDMVTGSRSRAYAFQVQFFVLELRELLLSHSIHRKWSVQRLYMTVMRYLKWSNNEKWARIGQFFISKRSTTHEKWIRCDRLCCVPHSLAACAAGSRAAAHRKTVDDVARLVAVERWKMMMERECVSEAYDSHGFSVGRCNVSKNARTRGALTTINFIPNTEWSGKWHTKHI